ncbi:MAG TPA: YbjN domain-containing protein [Actinomycetes bacterium]|nr:YbjN domain-containing protein [Actinomycetes bacterium]
MTDVAALVRDALASLEVDFEEPQPGTFVAVLPGERKLRTTCSLVIGPHSVTVNAFVVRHPDEKTDEVHQWLLRQNAKHPGLAYGIDPLGDVYLVGRLPLSSVSSEQIDLLLGRVLDTADSAFNTLLEIGFASSIRREWKWRVSRGESLANLAAFEHLIAEQDKGIR